jgi:hypothetical protein
MVATAWVVWGVWVHALSLDALNVTRARALRLLAFALITSGFLAGEYAFAPLFFVIAIEWQAPKDGRRQRALRLLPYAGVAAGYVVLRSVLGYGVAGSSFYIDPATEFARFISACLVRIPLLAGDLVLGIPAEWWYWSVPWRTADFAQRIFPEKFLYVESLAHVQLVLGVIALFASAAIGVRLFRGRARPLGALLLAALCSLIPLSGTASMSRLTLAPAIAFDAALGYALVWLVQLALDRRPTTGAGLRVGRPSPLVRSSAALGALLVLQLHVVRAARETRGGVNGLSEASVRDTRVVQQADFALDDLRGHDVIVVSAHDMATQYCLPYVLHLAGRTLPASSHILSPAAENEHILYRPASNILDLEYPKPLLGEPYSHNVYRRDDAFFYEGQQIPGEAFNIIVNEVRDGMPRRLTFIFRADMDDPRYVFMFPTKQGLKRFTLPRIGETQKLPAPAWPK